jgi:hypothetical protein
MTKASRRKQKNKEQSEASNDPWLSWRTGMLTNSVISLALAIFIIWQIYPVGGLGQALLWGIGAGLSIWLVFFVSYFVNSRIRRR